MEPKNSKEEPIEIEIEELEQVTLDNWKDSNDDRQWW